MNMATYNNLPLYNMTIDPNDDVTGVDFISFVTDPAIERNFVKFNQGKLIEKKYKFNTEKQFVSGPFMIPDMPIYRFDAELGEYYVTFSKQTIEHIVKKFMSQQKTLAFNYQHEDNSQIENAILIENWFVGKNDKVKDLGYNDLPEGTWFGTVYVANEKFWNDNVKTGDVKGFSIEGWLNMELSKIENKNKIKQIMSKRKFKSEVKTVDGLVIYADVLEVGAEVFTVDADGNEVPVADGEYKLEDGSKLIVAGGKITEVVAAEIEEEMSLSSEDVTNLLADLIAPYETRIKELEDKISAFTKTTKDLEVAMSTIPGYKKPSTKDDGKKESVKMSAEKRASIITEALNRVKNKNKK